MPSVQAIILNYKRPQNIARIVRACLACRIDMVHVIDQAAAENQLRRLPAAQRVNYVRKPNIGSGRRLPYAARLDCDLVLAIDDDIFLTPAQIEELIARGQDYPNRAHGVWGQLIVEEGERLQISDGVSNVNRRVDILNRVYLFKPAHAERALQIADLLKLPRNRLGHVDDILLSFGVPRKPLCHDLGKFADCETSNEVGTAVWREPGFEQTRNGLVERLREMGRQRGIPLRD